MIEHLRLDGQSVTDPLTVEPVGATECAARLVPSDDLISVVICTLGQDDRLRPAVMSVLQQTHWNLDVIVVDNSPESGRVVALLADVVDERLRIVPERRRGLSVARNSGLAACRSSIVAYTDDDALADPDWIRALVAPFDEHPGVTCVTGLVRPAELATPAQVWFEEFGGFGKGLERVVWTAGTADPRIDALGARGDGGILFPYSAGVFGSGNNMAFRTEWLRRNAMFDVALGAGTLTRGGEDLDSFLSVILSGGVVIYEPRAVVGHYGRGDMESLHKQMYGYGSGMCAVIAKHLVASPRSAVRIMARVPAGLRKLLDPGSEKNQDRTEEFPRELRRAELNGYLAGPALYVRSRRDARRRHLYDSPGIR